MSDEEFEYSGLVGRCASCSGPIACGLHHAGRVRYDSDEDDSTDEEGWTRKDDSTDEKGWTRKSLSACTSDYTTLTFYHMDPCASKRAMNSSSAAQPVMSSSGAAKPDMNSSRAAKPVTWDSVSAKWERLLLPLAVTPGADVGVTEAEYLWLLKQCRAKADWQLRQWQVQFFGKLVRCPQRTLEWRSKPPEDWEGGAHDALTRRVRRKLVGDETNFRARQKPLRQEPEWQFDDVDVATAWKRMDASLLDRHAPADLLSVGIKATACLGRWPRQAIKDVDSPHARREILLAKLLDATISKPMRSYACADFFEAVRCRTQLAALRRGSSSDRNAAKLVDEGNAVKLVDDPSARVVLKELLQSLGLEPQPVSASTVFRHTPAKNILSEELQKRTLESAFGHKGFFQVLELGWESTQPWDRFFMFTKHFQKYNESRMAAEDPKAHLWNTSKSFVDYTWCATASDWMGALGSLDSEEQRELEKR